MDWDLVGTTLAATGVVGAIVTAVVAYISHRQTRHFDDQLQRGQEDYRRLLETRAELDLDLREKRLPHYEALWALTAEIPRWPRRATLSYADLDAFSRKLRDWYFEQGGWLLSRSSREAYGKLQEALWHQETGVLAAQARYTQSRSGLVQMMEYDTVMRACSTLRTNLTDDLHSRRPGPLPDEAPPTRSRSAG